MQHKMIAIGNPTEPKRLNKSPPTKLPHSDPTDPIN